MVMEYVEGAPLPEWLKSRRPLVEGQVVAIAGPLLDGLEVIHAAGYMHRDVKPSNIYVRNDGSPVLLDFGSARQKSSELTAIVSPGYAPFEQYHTQGRQGPWSDIYAFAGVLYWMVTGERPVEAAGRVRKDTMPPAVQAGDRTRFRPEFLAALDWGLAPNEEDRPQTVAQWREALLGSATPEPQTRRAPPPAPAQKEFEGAFLQELEETLKQHVGALAPAMVRSAAKKAQNPGELVHMLAADITHDGTRLKFERRFADASRPVSQPVASAPPSRTEPSTNTGASRFPAQVLERAEKRLAQYLGPLARVFVRRAAVKARDESELYLLLADEIENPAEKKAFIRRAISTKA
jgi:serine/threonine protein kinase